MADDFARDLRPRSATSIDSRRTRSWRGTIKTTKDVWELQMPQSNDTDSRSHHALRYPLEHCPTCGSDRLEPVVETDTFEVHFLCRDCRRCWHVELGHVHRMAPDVCHGCPHRDDCLAVVAAERERGVHARD